MFSDICFPGLQKLLFAVASDKVEFYLTIKTMVL